MANAGYVVMGIIIVSLIAFIALIGYLLYAIAESESNLQANLNAARAEANRLAQNKQNAEQLLINIAANKQDLESQMNSIIEQAASNAVNAQVAQDQLDVLQQQLNALEQAAANAANVANAANANLANANANVANAANALANVAANTAANINAGGMTTVRVCGPWGLIDCPRAGPELTCAEFHACRAEHGRVPCAGNEWFNRCGWS